MPALEQSAARFLQATNRSDKGHNGKTVTLLARSEAQKRRQDFA